MINLIASIVLTSLLFPAGFNFFITKAIDYSSWQGQSVAQAPSRKPSNSFGLKTTAKSILVVDADSGSVLYHKDSSEVLPIASITKLLTALVILDYQPDWEKEVVVTADDQREGGQVYLIPGESVKVKDLFNIMLIGSANEAAVSLARAVAGDTDFVSAMNRKASELGMVDSYFVDPSGLEPGNISTTVDLLKLIEAAFVRSEIVESVTKLTYQFKVVNNSRQGVVYSTDYLLNSYLNQDNFEITGAKTGYLDEAGYCLVMKIKTKDGKNLLIATLGATTIDDRWQETKGLVDWVLDNYQWFDGS